MPKRGPHNSAITWTPHLRFAWGGHLGTGKEIWTNSLKFVYDAVDFVPTEAMLSAMDVPIFGQLNSYHTVQGGTFESFIGEDAFLDWIKINPITAQGLQFRSQTHRFDNPNGTTQGGNLNTVPYYQTFAITLRTALKRGRGHAGRVFPPLVQPNIENGTGMCSVAAATSMAGRFESLMKALQGNIVTASQAGKWAVLSPGDTTKGTTPMFNVITGCVADRVPDVQHRRTRQLPRSEGVLAALVQ